MFFNDQELNNSWSFSNTRVSVYVIEYTESKIRMESRTQLIPNMKLSLSQRK